MEFHHDSDYFLLKPVSQWFIIGFLLLTAFGIRLHNITKPPLDFAPIRQYQNAHIARGLYFENNKSISETRKQIAKLNMERMGFLLEPRIIEHFAVFGYRIAVSEQLWIPRVLSSLFWVIGGIFLYLTAIRISSSEASLFSTIYYLFLPYGISASRSFQPDSLMVMMMLASIYTILMYFENLSKFKLLISILISSVAILIKPYCLFMIWLVFIFVSIYKNGFRKTIFSIHLPIFVLISFFPAFVYYIYGTFSNVGFLQEHARSSFIPNLLLSLSFWKGWLVMIGSVTGYFTFILALYGFFNARKGLPKTLLIGLWIGYLLFGLSATFQIHTHSYYHMPFIPIAALSIGPIGIAAVHHLANLILKRWRFIALIVILVIISVASSREKLGKILSEYKGEIKFAGTVVGINPEFKEFIAGNYENEVRIAKEIGEYVRHGPNTVILAHDFGRVLAYHGELSGLPWPTTLSLHERKLRGTRLPNIHEDFTPKYINIGYQGKYIKYTPDYFIVTDFSEFKKQSDLREHLNRNFPLIIKNESYLIYDLRKMSE